MSSPTLQPTEMDVVEQMMEGLLTPDPPVSTGASPTAVAASALPDPDRPDPTRVPAARPRNAARAGMESNTPQVPTLAADTTATTMDGDSSDTDDHLAQQQQQQQLRQRILQLTANPTLSPVERARAIQTLMTASYQAARQSSTLAHSPMMMDIRSSSLEAQQPRTEVDGAELVAAKTLLMDDDCQAWMVPKCVLEPSYYEHADHQHQDTGVLGCSHYQRGAKFLAKCCNTWHVCRFCHDEQHTDHQLDRHATETMLCMHCQTVQPVAQDCAHCSQRLGSYFCEACKLWDNDTTKNIYHCDKCGICRLGKGLGIDYFHCDACSVCMSIQLKDNHRCIERTLDCDCPICGEYMFTSTQPVIFMPCSHCIHWSCHKEHIKNSYQCPICWKSLADMSHYFQQIDHMLQQHTMPAEYRDYWSHILCNDCEEKSKTRFHFLYHKCQSCGSYNTKLLQTVRELENVDASTGATQTTLVVIPTIETDNLLAVTAGPTNDELLSAASMSPSASSSRLRSSSSVSATSERFLTPDDNERRM